MIGVREDFGWFVHAWDEVVAADTLKALLQSMSGPHNNSSEVIYLDEARMLLIGVFCRLGWVEYGVSSRCAWLTDRGRAALELLKEHEDGVFELEPDE